VDVGLEVSEGKQVFVERIEISGNTKTRDKVIRREIALIEGDLYNSRLLARSRQNLNALGYFEDVKVDTRRGTAEDRVDIDVALKEKPTGSFAIGAGFSSIDGILGAGSISQNNFLGLGQRVSFSGQLGSKANRFVLRFQDPHIVDSDTSLDLSIYNQQLAYQSFTGFDQNSKGVFLSLGRQLYRELFGSISYRYEEVKIFNLVPSLLNNPNPLIVPGTTRTGSVGFGLSMDLRDNRRDPTRGFVGTATYALAAKFLGGDNEFNKLAVDLSYYWPLFWKFIGHVRGYLSIVEAFGDLPIPTQERIFLGGTNTVRGFKTYTLSPVDQAGNRIGGNKAIFFNNEVLFPIYEPLGVKGLFFFDAGQAFLENQALSLELRPTAGAGLRVATPFGLVRVEYGFNLDRHPGDTSGAAHLTVGSVF
jgi:outer membrane protein insertion porin family